MLLLFQEGIPGVFFPDLEKRGVEIKRFPTDSAAAQKVFRANAATEAIFFRANFRLSEKELDVLPKLRLAALVSTGSDNVDAAAFEKRNVAFVTGEGANAQAVFDYVMHSLCLGEIDLERQSVGIVGVGRVGGRVLRFLKELKVETAHYDPFLADPGSLEKVLECDFVSFHVPLTHLGGHKTAGMLNFEYFKPARKKIQLIQTCRGGIWDKAFYMPLAAQDKIAILAQDVYPAEPPDITDLKLAKFSTPHIAGYSTIGRLGGIVRGIQAVFPDFSGEGLMPEGRDWFLDGEATTFAAQPQQFSAIRDNYFWRKEFSEYNSAEREKFENKFPRMPGVFFEKLFR